MNSFRSEVAEDKMTALGCCSDL